MASETTMQMNSLYGIRHPSIFIYLFIYFREAHFSASSEACNLADVVSLNADSKRQLIQLQVTMPLRLIVF